MVVGRLTIPPLLSAGTKLNNLCWCVEVPGDREAGIVQTAEVDDAEVGNRLQDMWL